MVRKDTLRTSYCRWTSRETATYQRHRGEEHHSRCIPVALCKRGVGTECWSGASRTPETAIRGPGLDIACGARVQTSQVAQRLRRFDEGPPPGSERIPSTPPSEVEDRLIFEPVLDRWRIGYKRNLLDPYNQNVLKGDYPIPGTQNLFFVFTGISDTLAEVRSLPIPSGVSAARADSYWFLWRQSAGHLQGESPPAF